MAWGKKKKVDTGIPSVSIAVSEVMRVKSKYEGDTGYYSVQLEYPGSIFDNNRIEKVELRPRSKEEFDVYEVGQRVTVTKRWMNARDGIIGAQPWTTTPTEAAVDMRAEGVDWEMAWNDSMTVEDDAIIWRHKAQGLKGDYRVTPEEHAKDDMPHMCGCGIGRPTPPVGY